VSKATKEKEAKAELSSAIAFEAQVQRELEAKLEQPFSDADACAESGDPASALMVDRKIESFYREPFVEMTTVSARVATQALIEAREEVERAKRIAQELKARAARRLDWVKRMVEPQLKAWVKKNAAKGRKSFPFIEHGCTAGLRATKPSAEIEDASQIRAWLDQEGLTDEAYVDGVIRVKEEFSRTALLAWASEKGRKAPGVKYYPAGNSLITQRRNPK
jgi:phage host-nuclease inhibitor protein Gam